MGGSQIPIDWRGVGIGRQAGLKNPWCENTVRVQISPAPLIETTLSSPIVLLPFHSGGGLGGDVVDDAGYAGNFVHNPRRNFL